MSYDIQVTLGDLLIPSGPVKNLQGADVKEDHLASSLTYINSKSLGGKSLGLSSFPLKKETELFHLKQSKSKAVVFAAA